MLGLGVLPAAATYGDCTLGFLFTGSDRRRYAATAGHCGAANGVEMSWGPTAKGPAVSDANGRLVGRFAYVITRATPTSR